VGAEIDTAQRGTRRQKSGNQSDARYHSRVGRLLDRVAAASASKVDGRLLNLLSCAPKPKADPGVVAGSSRWTRGCADLHEQHAVPRDVRGELTIHPTEILLQP